MAGTRNVFVIWDRSPGQPPFILLKKSDGDQVYVPEWCTCFQAVGRVQISPGDLLYIDIDVNRVEIPSQRTTVFYSAIPDPDLSHPASYQHLLGHLVRPPDAAWNQHDWELIRTFLRSDCPYPGIRRLLGLSIGNNKSEYALMNLMVTLWPQGRHRTLDELTNFCCDFWAFLTKHKSDTLNGQRLSELFQNCIDAVLEELEGTSLYGIYSSLRWFKAVYSVPPPPPTTDRPILRDFTTGTWPFHPEAEPIKPWPLDLPENELYSGRGSRFNFLFIEQAAQLFGPEFLIFAYNTAAHQQILDLWKSMIDKNKEFQMKNSLALFKLRVFEPPEAREVNWSEQSLKGLEKSVKGLFQLVAVTTRASKLAELQFQANTPIWFDRMMFGLLRTSTFWRGSSGMPREQLEKGEIEPKKVVMRQLDNVKQRDEGKPVLGEQ
jgi:hypothetical protein